VPVVKTTCPADAREHAESITAGMIRTQPLITNATAKKLTSSPAANVSILALPMSRC
jgi:hypothetical protein